MASSDWLTNFPKQQAKTKAKIILALFREFKMITHPTKLKYETFQVKVLNVRAMSIYVMYEGQRYNIPRSCLSWKSDREIDNLAYGNEVSLEIVDWKVDQLAW